MTVGIAAPAPEVIYHRAVKTKKKPINDDLCSQLNVVVDLHATQITKSSTFPEASNQHFEKLKQHEQHEKAKWNEVIDMGD